MRHVKMVGLCLLAVFAFGAVVASAAQAEGPEWGRCVKLAKDKGKYKDANCQELEGKANGKGVFKAKAKGFYEWEGNANTTCYEEPGKKGKYKNNTCTELEGKTKKGVFTPEEKGKYEKVAAGSKFTGTGGQGKLWGSVAYAFDCENGPGEERGKLYTEAACSRNSEEGEVWGGFIATPAVECASEASSGEATGTNGVANVKVTFKGCTLFETISCSSEGAKVGEIVVTTLKGELGYINKAKKEVGVLLKPAAGTTFASFRCFNEAEEDNSEFVVGVGNETEGAAYKPEATGGNDGVISPVTPVDAMTSTLTQQYTVSQEENANKHFAYEGSHAYNVPQKFETGPVTALEVFDQSGEAYEKGEHQESSLWSEAGEEITNVATPEGAIEIKA